MKYRFGSFNMNNMGMSAMTGRDFDRIAEIIKRENLDVVALQEILSEGKALEKLLEDISFNIADMEEEKITIDREYVKEKFEEKIHPDDLDRYIL